MAHIRHNLTKAEKRKRRVRATLHGTAERPRVSVYRSNRYTFLQAIDDDAGETVASVHDKALINEDPSMAKKTKTERAAEAAARLAEALKAEDITAAVFDRGPYRYHGRVRTVAETLRENDIAV